MSLGEVPLEIVALINERAGREHTAEGQVLSTMKEALRMYDLDRVRRVLAPGITVLVATHPERQTSGLINRAFASIAAQTLQPAVIVIANDLDRLGAGATRRRLLEAVHTEWIAWLDSDDEWGPDHLAKLMQVATETDSVYVFSWFHGNDPLGHFGLPFNPCTPHHTTMTVLVRTELAQEVGFRDSEGPPFSNEDWSWICGVASICCERELKMTHLAERTWTYHQHGQNSSGLPGQGDASSSIHGQGS